MVPQDSGECTPRSRPVCARRKPLAAVWAASGCEAPRRARQDGERQQYQCVPFFGSARYQRHEFGFTHLLGTGRPLKQDHITKQGVAATRALLDAR